MAAPSDQSLKGTEADGHRRRLRSSMDAGSGDDQQAAGERGSARCHCGHLRVGPHLTVAAFASKLHARLVKLDETVEAAARQMAAAGVERQLAAEPDTS